MDNFRSQIRKKTSTQEELQNRAIKSLQCAQDKKDKKVEKYQQISTTITVEPKHQDVRRYPKSN